MFLTPNEMVENGELQLVFLSIMEFLCSSNPSKKLAEMDLATK